MAYMPIEEGYASFGEYRTWYRVTGDRHTGSTPLVILHGGPGCTHDYVDSFKDIASTGRTVIHYDQLGNGLSTHLPHKGTAFWTVDLFLKELDNLLAHLKITDNYVLLGQSWGGMLASEHAVLQPPGLKALIIANSPADMHTWASEANRLRKELPEAVQTALSLHEQAGTLDHPDYLAASGLFHKRHVCRVKRWPDEVKRTFEQIDKDPTVYHSMNGPTEFHVTGTLKDWSIVDRLPLVNVPALLISGRHDEATSTVVRPYVKKIRGIVCKVFEDSSHMPHVEERIACMGCVANFLDNVADANRRSVAHAQTEEGFIDNKKLPHKEQGSKNRVNT
ncbi:MULTISPECIES: proline iminopeptidase-family hydrolase [Pseudomonas syringae group]|uniref:Peptidase S33, tricorn interacting factor 1 n=2 Tax=Pseudomonas syringae group TaxID=136849 RepID=A0AA40P4F4_9PSED|nr:MULTISPECIES: proline iminopeptidase-family hydrolase [Pseudomonas syringae group]KPX32082.1 Peptidase S33, tricorn interacting factor 1 [Pseudomonas coronafaciens pv. garcae]KPZ00786.1 Peptidase S33, tricorn interacting factor 1 [Pseudomonas tremae]MCF5801768.1 proline iminopeptidase-family hydrolase [Pseudomonas tremae]MCF5807349.1 proline iminopeptidase-family hydrolase [Pseudomonas tremae]MCQ3015914.1 proline iminopeptidase-family hydrolase [Pseudomonas tremae]